MKSETRNVRLATGVNIEYVDEGHGPAMLLLHGYSDSYRSYDLVRPLLPRGLRVIAMTLRGHGRSDHPASCTIAEMAADAAALLDVLGIDRAIIVGHSLGSSVALEIGASYPERVAGLALLGAFANYDANPGVRELFTEVSQLSDAAIPAFARAFQESTLANPTPEGFLDMAVGESCLLAARTWQAIGAGFAAFDPLAAARRCQAPALIVSGDQDAFVPHEDGAKLAAAVPSARLFTLTDVGHALHWESPNEVALMLCAFAGELEDGRVAA